MALAAGQKVRASDVNALLPLWGYVPDDQSITSSATLAAVVGLTVTLEANARYAVSGYLAYVAGATGDIKVALTVPTGASGHWTLYGQATTATAGLGSMDVRRSNSFGTGSVLAAAGEDATGGYMAALPRAYIATDVTGGALSVYFAQNTSNGTATVVRAGSWLKVVKLP